MTSSTRNDIKEQGNKDLIKINKDSIVSCSDGWGKDDYKTIPAATSL